MKFVHYDEPGNPEVLRLSQKELPQIKEDELLIKVYFAGINRPDIVQRQGNYPPPPGHSKVLGLEISGVIEKQGSLVKNFSVGDKIAALVDGGGYAEYCVANVLQTFKIPKNLSFEEAAGIPECFFTAWSNLVKTGQVKDNQQVLIHGGTSGVGLACIQILKLLKCKIFTTVGSNEKKIFCKKIGVDNIINYKESDFYEEIKKSKNFKGLNLILDIIGADYVMKNIDLLSIEGKLINIAFQKSSKVELNLIKVMLKRLIITGSTLRIRSKYYKNEILKELIKKIFPYFENNSIKCYIDSIFSFNDIVSAHKSFEKGEHIGKILIRIGG